jgi:hypothetical protein
MSSRRPLAKRAPAKKAAPAKKLAAKKVRERAVVRREQRPDGVRIEMTEHFDPARSVARSKPASRLARECFNLSPDEEVAFAEVGLGSEVDGWPQY